jgi:hypothetical protein
MQPPQEQFAELRYPLAGISLLRGFEDQRPVPMPEGVGPFAHTAREGVNVRSCEPGTARIRGGSRPGLSRYVPEPVVADWIIQNLAVITTVSEDATT